MHSLHLCWNSSIACAVSCNTPLAHTYPAGQHSLYLRRQHDRSDKLCIRAVNGDSDSSKPGGASAWGARVGHPLAPAASLSHQSTAMPVCHEQGGHPGSLSLLAAGPSLTDPVQTIAWGGTLPSSRRAFFSVVSGTAIGVYGCF